MKRLAPACGYVRRSTDRQEASLHDQRKAIEKFAAQNGYHVVRFYADDAVSGDETHKRVGFRAMHDDATGPRRDFDTIICWDYSRFGRFDSLEAGRWIDPLRRAGVRLLTLDKGIVDWSSFVGRIVNALEAEAKHAVLRDTSRTSLRGQIANAENGFCNGQRPPFALDRALVDETGAIRQIVGYGEQVAKPKSWKVKLVPSQDSEKVATLLWLFQQYDERDVGMRTLADELNVRGVPSPLGKGWSQPTIREILKNENYLGRFCWGRKAEGKYHRATPDGPRERNVIGPSGEPRVTANPRQEWIFAKSANEPMIEPELFKRVQAKIARRRSSTTPRSPKDNRFLLSGLLICKTCGRKMVGTAFTRRKKKKEYRYFRYICPTACQQGPHNATGCGFNGIEQEPLVQFLASTLKRAVLGGGCLDALTKEIRTMLEASRDADPKRLALVRKAVDTLSAEIGRLVRSLRVLDGPAADAVATELKIATAEKERRQAELSDLERVGSTDDLDAEAASIAAQTWTLAEDLDSADASRVREVLKRLVGRIELSFDKVPRLNRTETPFREGIAELRLGPILPGVDYRAGGI